MCNVEYQDKVCNLTLKLNAMEENLKKSRNAATYLNHCNSCVNDIAKVDKE